MYILQLGVINLSEKKTILMIIPANATKAYIVLNSLWRSSYFLSSYEVTFLLDSNVGINYDWIKDREFKYYIRNKTENAYGLKESFDYVLSCGWGELIPIDVIRLARIAALNCHSSYLPDYKGGSVYYHQWANLGKYGGATIHILNEAFDEGNIICQDRFLISYNDKPKDILQKASEITCGLLREALLLTEKNYLGERQTGGRYFLKTSRLNLLLHRVVNRFLSLIRLKKRWLTKYRCLQTKP